MQLSGSRLARGLLALFGWHVEFDGLPARQGVIIVYPHTSNWDFVVGIMTKWTIGIQVSFWGKDALFRVPLLGVWLRWLGGVAVDRSTPGGVAEQMAARMRRAREQNEFLWLALAPEGTRSLREHWRSGFYPVVVKSGVPLAVVFFDFQQRRVVFAGFLALTGQIDKDLAEIARLLTPAHGKRPELAGPIRFKS